MNPIDGHLSAAAVVMKVEEVLARYRAPVGISKHDALAEIGEIVDSYQQNYVETSDGDTPTSDASPQPAVVTVPADVRQGFEGWAFEQFGSLASTPDAAWLGWQGCDTAKGGVSAKCDMTDDEAIRFARSVEAAIRRAGRQASAVPPEWVSEMVGGELEDLTAGQGYRRGWNDCRARMLAGSPAVAPALPDRQRLLALVDLVWNAATESTEVPDTVWAYQLIDRALGTSPCPQGDALKLLKDARHRIANLSRAVVPFDDPLDGPVLRRLDTAIDAAVSFPTAETGADHG